MTRWWHIFLLRKRGWPDPERTVDWLDERPTFFDMDDE